MDGKVETALCGTRIMVAHYALLADNLFAYKFITHIIF